jgi:photosystem I P700 chlorophyll a apoprotein A2
MLEHKEAIISHLSWASLFLASILYIHNDTVVAFMENLFEPLFAEYIQAASGKVLNLMFYYQIQLVHNSSW